MDEEHLVPRTISICSAFRQLLHHFLEGNGPIGERISSSEMNFGFTFDSHPGPIEDCIHDSKINGKSIFIFIYCCDNPNTIPVADILRDPEISQDIRENFLFLPIDITWPDGWYIATQLEFSKLPLIALVHPRGSTLWESEIYMKNEGMISRSYLLSAIHVRQNPDLEIISNQNIEFDEAVRAEEEAQIRLNNQTQNAIQESRNEFEEIQRINQAYENIPIPNDSQNSITIRFRFPDNKNQTRDFPADGPTSYLFDFVRKTMHPHKFNLLTGYPQITLEDNDNPINSVIPDRHCIIYVDDDD